MTAAKYGVPRNWAKLDCHANLVPRAFCWTSFKVAEKWRGPWEEVDYHVTLE